MMETSRRKILFYSLYPLIGKDLTTGVAEASFKGARNNNILLKGAGDRYTYGNLTFRDHGKRASSLLCG